MQDNESGQRQKSPCSTKKVPMPEFIACIRCGEEIEIWTDEEETCCPSCSHRVFKKETIIH